MNILSDESNTKTNIILSTCANCGKEGSDITNTCNKCNSVKYCNAACKKKHRHKHKKECDRRVAELHDEKLFKQPPPEEDCPICFMQLPHLGSGTTYMNCCGLVICCGCIHAFQSRMTSKKDDVCPFCRTPAPESQKEMIKRFEKRMELKDAQATYQIGSYYARGLFGLPQKQAKAFELLHRAGELGFAQAYYILGQVYEKGTMGVVRDEKKAIYYWELAAMSGSSRARHNLAVEEWAAGNMDRALKHYMIAARGGESKSLEAIQELFMNGHATKDDYAKALSSYQAYLDVIKSDQRDEAAAYRDEAAKFSDENKYY